MKKLYSFILFTLTVFGLSAQHNRFVQQVFTDAQIKVDSNLTYGTALNFSPAVMVPLKMDVYYPDTAVDTLKSRPVIIIFHSGSFLPPNLNAGVNGGAYFGSRRDSAVVELCRRFAKRGWVAIAGTHRLGWIANSPSQNTQKITIMRAVYRATQDGRTLMRYMRRSIDSMGNLYRINGDQIVIGGTSSGAYVALHANSLDLASDIMTPGLLDSIGNSVIDTVALGGFYAGNYPGYNSRPNLVLSLGGAVADTLIMSSSDVPIVAFHGISDPTTPYNRGIVINAGTLTPITTVDGSNNFILAANNKGINSVLGPGPRAGLRPFSGAGFEPYGWYNKPPNFAPGNIKSRGLLYIDTILNEFTPYAVSVLGLETNDPASLNRNLISGFNVFPNPAGNQVSIQLKEGYNQFRTVKLTTIDGKTFEAFSCTGNEIIINTSNYIPGIYIILAETTLGMISSKIIIE